MMPTEQLQTELGYTDVYLVEARSLGGLSGSPVFVRPTGKIPCQAGPDSKIEMLLGVREQQKLLGIMHGHWDVKESEINNPIINHDRRRGVNYGIAIVTPAIKIIETLNRRDLEERRMRYDDNLKKQRIPGMDSARPAQETQTTPQGVDIPIPTQEQFLDDLTKASRRVKSD